MVDGHLRVTLAMRYNQEKVPVTYLDLTDQEEKKALAIYDRITAMAVEDENILSGLMQEIEFEDGDILAEMFSEISTENKSHDNNSDGKKTVVCPNCEYEFGINEGSKAKAN